jgi:hypothetical protein
VSKWQIPDLLYNAKVFPDTVALFAFIGNTEFELIEKISKELPENILRLNEEHGNPQFH